MFDWLNGQALVLLGLVLIGAASLMRLSRGRRGGTTLDEERTRLAIEMTDRRYSQQFQHMEVRLQELLRDVEGRVQTRLALLDEYIARADQEADRLQTLLSELTTVAREPGSDTPPTSRGTATASPTDVVPAPHCVPIWDGRRTVYRPQVAPGANCGAAPTDFPAARPSAPLHGE